MMSSGVNDAVIAKLRNELRQNNVKLWEEPYTNADESSTDEIVTLGRQYADKLNLPLVQVQAGLEQLRCHALDRLKEKYRLATENIATLRLKFATSSPITENFKSIETSLLISGKDFMELIAKKLNMEVKCLKLIYQGKMLDLQRSLASQGVQHNKLIMCMIFLTDNAEQTRELEKQMENLRKAKRGAELLASSSNATAQNYDAQITDQNGRTIDIPEEEKQSLTVALALHEQGRAILKKKRYDIALLFLLEADKEFQQCRAEILKMVDNFAVLLLDISWCYLRLENLDALPNVSERLKVSEESFTKTYGESLQRLLTIKGSSGHEIALFVRLYLLQAIVAFHEGKFAVARDLLAKAKSFAASVNVEEDKLLELVNLGFTASQSRLALRACHGDLNAASTYAFQKREEKERILKEEKEKSRKQRLARSFGPCANGDDVDVDLYEKMIDQLGFDKRLSAEALRQCDNDLNRALELINSSPELLRNTDSPMKITPELLKQITAVGFDAVSARAALTHFVGDIHQSLDYLLANSGIVPGDWLQTLQSTSGSEFLQHSQEDENAIKKLAKVIKNEGDYLDVTLNEELEYISVYQGMVHSILE